MAQENQDSKKRAAVGKMTGFIGVLCNLLLAGSKLVIGSWPHLHQLLQMD